MKLEKLEVYNLEFFLGLSPELVGQVNGVDFYEHPLRDDLLVAVDGEECFLCQCGSIIEVIEHEWLRGEWSDDMGKSFCKFFGVSDAS